MKIYSQSRHILSDTITPIGTFLNLRDRYPSSSLFESSDYNSKNNSRSFIGAEPLVRINSAEEFTQYEFSDEQLGELNGFFGLFAYDAVNNFEDIELKGRADLPQIYFVIYRYLIVFDNFKNEATIIENSLSEDFNGLEQLEIEIFKNRNYASTFQTNGDAESNYTDQSFEEMISKGKAQVALGEVFQLVLSRKFFQKFKGDDFEVYRQLRALNPSPYMFYFDLDKAKLFGASPEAQFKVKSGIAEINPIAGTVKRSGNIQLDKELSVKLAEDAKENAEHTMLVDLARNDLNKYCDDVTAVRLKEIQEFSHVIHMVSNIQGKLKGKSAIEAFGGSFPAGTLSGAPKYRAMELINQFEEEARGFYGGAIGHIAANGDMNLAIIIRSCLSKNNLLEYQAGAGVVMDSNEVNEVAEVYSKARVINRAIALANKSHENPSN